MHLSAKNNLFLLGASQTFKEEKKSGESSTASASGPVAETFRVIQGAISKEFVRSTQGVFQFELSGKKEQRL